MTAEEISKLDLEYGARLSVLEERLRAADERLKEQATEYERRLSEIYNACDSVTQMLAAQKSRFGGISWVLAQAKWIIPIVISIVGVWWIVMHTG